MPTTCQLPNQPSQEWRTSHLAYNGGRLDGFVSSPIGPTNATEVGGVAMGYWTGDDLPYTYALARTFPLADRYFSSVLGQTDANRRYLIAGTSSGMTDEIDTPADVNGTVGVPSVAGPANGTIFEQLSQHGITWADYTNDFPAGATPELYPIPDTGITAANKRPTAQFLTDAAGGTLPQFSLVEPDYSTQSQENPQNIAVGEAFLAGIVNALGASPSGSGRCSSSPTTSTAATTTMSRPRWRWPPTTSRPTSTRGRRPTTGSSGTASGCRAWWSPRSPSATT